MRRWLVAGALLAVFLLASARQADESGAPRTRGEAVPRALRALVELPTYGAAQQEGQPQAAASHHHQQQQQPSAASTKQQLAARRQPGSCRRFRPPQVPVLSVARVWRSARPRRPTDVTLVTQLSVERLYMLEQQCGVWGSVIAAAVHVPLVGAEVISADEPSLNGSSLERPNRMLEEFVGRMEAGSRCTLDLALVTEDVPALELVGLYPVNALRNRALMLAETEVVLLLDADFLPSANLTDTLHQPEHYEQLRRSVGFRQGVVLPAFETADGGEEGRGVALAAVTGGKGAAAEAFSRGHLKVFHSDHFDRGHRATDFDKWITARLAYRVPYEEGFEPYVFVARRFVPWYDERFKGYRKNKVVHLMHMRKLGLHFVVTPHGYVVHSPHPTAQSWAVTKSSGFWDKLVKLYARVRDEMEAGQFVPATGFKCESTAPETWTPGLY